jgi:hypothetical protein
MARVSGLLMPVSTSAVVDQIDVHMIESKRERQPNPEDTRGNLS